MSDEMNETQADTAAQMCLWMIVLTSVMLVGSILIVNAILAEHYAGRQWF